MLAHGGVFVEEQVEWLGALVRLSRHEEGFQKAIGAEPYVGDESTGVTQPVHGQSHQLRRRLRRGGRN